MRGGFLFYSVSIRPRRLSARIESGVSAPAYNAQGFSFCIAVSARECFIACQLARGGSPPESHQACLFNAIRFQRETSHMRKPLNNVSLRYEFEGRAIMINPPEALYSSSSPDANCDSCRVKKSVRGGRNFSLWFAPVKKLTGSKIVSHDQMRSSTCKYS